MDRFRQNKLIFLFIAIVAAVMIFENMIFIQASYKYKEAYYDSVRRNLSQTTALVIDSYHGMSGLVIQDILTEETVDLVARARDADEQERQILRQQLLSKYAEFYEEMKTIGFRQFHFHLPGAVSFLRFHNPELYGDDLSGIRETVEAAQDTGKPVVGFEEGRIFNGYRFVYPIFSGSELVGSVEASISYQTVDNLAGDVTGYHALFMVQEAVVESRTFEEESGHYFAMESFPGFMVETLTLDLEGMIDYLGLDEDTFALINRQVGENIASGMYDEWELNIHDFDQKTIFTVVQPIENFSGETIAFNIYYGLEPAFHETTANDRFTIVATYLLNVMIMLAMFLLFLRMSRQRDNETNFLNRQRFNQLLSTPFNGPDRALILVELERIEEIRSLFGHIIFTETIGQVANLLRSCLTKTDIPYRLDQGILAIHAEGADRSQAEEKAQRIRKAFDSQPLGVGKLSVRTVVILVASGDSLTDVIENSGDELVRKALLGNRKERK